MEFKLLLSLQFSYMLLGMLYNIVSLILLNMTGKGLSSFSPVTGIIAMFAYGALLISGCLQDKLPYRLLMFVALVILGYFGVIKNLKNYTRLNLYHSGVVWFLAVIINTYGAFLNFIAVLGKYKLWLT